MQLLNLALKFYGIVKSLEMIMENIEEKNKDESLGETFKTVIYAIVIAGLIRTFLFEPFKIPSGSMYPTLEIGDFLFVSKYTYGYSRHSFPFSRPAFEGRVWEDLPERGDVVVFKYPGDNKTDFIKRVIGLPGDTVQMKGGRLFINGKMVEREEVGKYTIDRSLGRAGCLPVETLPLYRRIIETYEGNKLEIKDGRIYINGTPADKYTFAMDYYFMMGDNRDNSNDSRKDVGFVPFENIEGKARFLFYSHDDSVVWYNPISWIAAIRWGRLFNTIK